MIIGSIIWILAYAAGFILEASVIPGLGGAVGLPLSAGVFVLGSTLLPFWSGLAFAILTGIIRDAAAPSAAALHTATALLAFAAIFAVRTIVAWDEPWRRITAVTAAIFILPLARMAVAALARPWFPDVSTYRWHDLATGFALRQGASAFILVAVFAFWAVWVARRERARRLTRL